MNFRKTNNLVGWAIGIIATIVYLITMEPTTSFWDCGEFISVAHTLGVGHSPGAPFFMLLGRMFSMLAPDGNVALFVNGLSAIASGMTILFLFWSITHFARRIIGKPISELSSSDIIMIMGAGAVGGLAYTFSDTFWFSAVEGEVYATSSFLTALGFWAMLKWEEAADEPHSDRWIVFIAYLMGISVGVHLLNLLVIPALAMIYYFRKYKKTTVVGGIAAFVIGCVILALIQFGAIQGIPKLASVFELMFVNSFGLGYDWGAIFFLVIFVAILVGLLLYAKKKKNYTLHIAVLSSLFILIGISSYFAAIIRSRADVPIDMTNPDNVMNFLPYVQREQFGQQPLLYGPDFDAPVVDIVETGKSYAKSLDPNKAQYDVVGKKIDLKYDPRYMRLFPRIWGSNEGSHVNFYRNYLGLSPNERPTTGDNINFFVNYHLNWMWWRYFMWNYAGRQNDIEGQGDPQKGNWISGIKPLDKMRVGDMSKMSEGIRNNPARNEYYLLPLILGVMGLVFHFNKHKQDALVTLILFFFTGIAIAIYLNMTPLQPRERDYAFAGSTYAFAIWIGLGVFMLNDWLSKFIKNKSTLYISILLSLVLVPGLMAKENWDDHDRSHKTWAKDYAINILSSLDSNAILFTYADNDTYPLWYMQEVERYRTDVRIINLSLLGIDWYIDQLNYKINDADAVPMYWSRESYRGDNLNYIRYMEDPRLPADRFYNLADICDFFSSNDVKKKVRAGNGELSNYLPAKNVVVPAAGYPGAVVDSNGKMENMRFTINMKDNVLRKNDLAVLNIIAAVAKEGWKRPIYYCGGLSGTDFLGMEDYAVLEGISYRITPVKRMVTFDSVNQTYAKTGLGTVNIDKTYNLFANTFTFGGAETGKVYFDEKNRNIFIAFRQNAARIATELHLMGQNDKGLEVLDKVINGISEYAYPHDIASIDMVAAYFRCGAPEKAKKLANTLYNTATSDLNYIFSLSDKRAESLAYEVQQNMTILNALTTTMGEFGEQEISKQYDEQLQSSYQQVMSRLGHIFGGNRM